MSAIDEIQKRKTFGIVSHPDAGKTTLTEKLLLFGGAIQEAGAVKSNKIKKHATSDFMEIERQRGISVATSVMAFPYRDHQVNILDTPGHKDFAEDTFRTLTTSLKGWKRKQKNWWKSAVCAIPRSLFLSTNWTGKEKMLWICLMK